MDSLQDLCSASTIISLTDNLSPYLIFRLFVRNRIVRSFFKDLLTIHNGRLQRLCRIRSTVFQCNCDIVCIYRFGSDRKFLGIHAGISASGDSIHNNRCLTGIYIIFIRYPVSHIFYQSFSGTGIRQCNLRADGFSCVNVGIPIKFTGHCRRQCVFDDFKIDDPASRIIARSFDDHVSLTDLLIVIPGNGIVRALAQSLNISCLTVRSCCRHCNRRLRCTGHSIIVDHSILRKRHNH